jgi:hypothetical protein
MGLFKQMTDVSALLTLSVDHLFGEDAEPYDFSNKQQLLETCMGRIGGLTKIMTERINVLKALADVMLAIGENNFAWADEQFSFAQQGGASEQEAKYIGDQITTAKGAYIDNRINETRAGAFKSGKFDEALAVVNELKALNAFAARVNQFEADVNGAIEDVTVEYKTTVLAEGEKDPDKRDWKLMSETMDKLELLMNQIGRKDQSVVQLRGMVDYSISSKSTTLRVDVENGLETKDPDYADLAAQAEEYNNFAQFSKVTDGDRLPSLVENARVVALSKRLVDLDALLKQENVSGHDLENALRLVRRASSKSETDQAKLDKLGRSIQTLKDARKIQLQQAPASHPSGPFHGNNSPDALAAANSGTDSAKIQPTSTTPPPPKEWDQDMYT